MLEKIYFREFADYFKKWFDNNYENLIKNIRSCNVDLWLSSGSIDHWLNSIQFAINTKGYMIWGKHAKDLSSLSASMEDSKSFNELEVLVPETTKPFIENYIGMTRDGDSKPMINIFYVKEKGIIGAGIFVMLIFDVNTLFWKEEIDRKRVIYPIRWLTKVFWLHKTVRTNPLDPNKWEGDKPPKGIPLLSALQHIKVANHVKDICELLSSHEGEFMLTRQFFEEYYSKISQTMESATISIPESCVVNTDIDIKKVKDGIESEFIIDKNIVDWILSLLLYSCKNILLLGKPGTGKTTLAKKIAEELKFKPVVFTAHAHWSRHDVIGGPMLSRNGEVIWRSGVLIKALAEHFRAKREGFRGAWLIIDEINRADVDKAFGEFFTIFSGADASEWIIPLHLIKEIKEYASSDRVDEDAKEFLNNICKDGFQPSGCRVPPDFRVIATLNYVDVANLFTLGEAFVRRFARIVIGYNDVNKEIKWFIDNRIESLYGKEMIKTLEDVVSKLNLADVIKKLRDLQGIAFGPAHVFMVLQNIAGYIKLNKGVQDLKAVARKAIEVTLTLNPLWDEELRKKVEEILSAL